MRIVSVIVFLLLFLFVFTQSLVVAQSEEEATSASSPVVVPVNSYELFWPIAPGKVMGDPLYFLKSFKEGLRELFIFGSFQKADYNITLSEKRLVEAEYLFITKGDSENAKKSLEASKAKIEKALSLTKKAEGVENFSNLKSRFINSLEKQRTLLNYLATQIPEDQKSFVSQQEDYLSDILSQLQ